MSELRGTDIPNHGYSTFQEATGLAAGLSRSPWLVVYR